MLNQMPQVSQKSDLDLDISKYESQTQVVAKQILSGTEKNSVWAKLSQIKDELRIDDKLMAWTMANDGLRVQLFRLIDCLPALQSKAEIARHMQEYLASDAVEVPALRSLLNFSTDNPRSMTATAAATTLATAVATLAKRYICGENLGAATKTIERLRRDRLAFTMDLLGEAVISESEAQGYLDRYLAMI
jgi:RHH-type transcriptional regulator, proline utilization regulon repressor / proline dehydrogenase / delta 1-pyrroline-5-carboxylate dehydrogenase